MTANQRYLARRRGESVPLLRHKWTEMEDARIRQVYLSLKRGDGQIGKLSIELETSIDKIQSRASSLGITKPNRLFSQEARTKFSRQLVEKLRTDPERFSTRLSYGRKNTAGRREDLKWKYFRSSWEANYARFLTFTHVRWEYEVKTFWFEKIRRGVRSYTPDFYLPDEDVYHEVKGWMDAKSATKLKRMKIYHPSVKVVVIDREFFNAANRQGLCRIIPHWECRHKAHNGMPKYVQSEETKRKRSESLKGRNFSQEHRSALSRAMTGRMSPKKGTVMSSAQREKLRTAWVIRKGRLLS